MKFRALRADEVECRVATVTEKGCSLLLYKDARCDMNILDETVGAERWQRSHELINGNLFCNVGINFPDQNGFDRWVWKQDVGTESYTEKEKGQASDSFKRACFCWGLGRELYTAPFIWITADNVKLVKKNDGKPTTYDRFDVVSMEVDNGKITQLTIKNTTLKKVVFNFGNVKEKVDDINAEIDDVPRDANLINADQTGKLKLEMLRTGATEEYLCKYYKLEKLIDMSVDQWTNAMAMFKKTPDRKKN